MQNQEYEIDLMELAIYFCHRWKKILLCAVAGLAIGFAIGAKTAAVSYTATARFVVSALSSTASSSSTSRSAKSNYAGDAGSLLGENLTVDSSSDESTESVDRYSSFGDSADVALYAGDIVKNDVVLQPVIDSLALDATCYNAAIQEQSIGIHYNVGKSVLDYVKNQDDFKFVDGRVQLPVRPGLGVDVNKELVLEENKTPHEWKNPVWRHKDGSVAEW